MTHLPKKKILFAITKGNWGGAQRYVFDLATNLSKDEFEVTVALGAGDILKEKLEAAGIRVIEFSYWQRDIRIFDEIRSFFTLIKLFRTEKPDIVHVNSSKIGGLGSLAGRIARVPKIIFTAHGWPFWEDRTIISKSIIWFFSWLTALFSHKIICISKYDLSVAQRMPFIGEKAVLIYNGIGPMNLGTGAIIRNAFPKGSTITGTIGELNKNKNQITLIEAAKDNPSLCIAIVGEGEERTRLEKKIKEYHLEDRVKLFGFRPAHEVLRGFDRFALPSLKEGLPYVLIEAKMAGLPIDANRVGGIPEILDKDISEFSLSRMVSETISVYKSANVSENQ